MMTMAASKGKWIPGTRDVPSRNCYSCDCCDRHFMKATYLDKHLTTELHFKRAAQAQQSSERHFSDFGDVLPCEPRRSCRSRTGEARCYGVDAEADKNRASDISLTSRTSRSRSQTASELGSDSVDRSNSTHTRCPTCYCKVVRKQMGKHLISHFHCQRTRNARGVNHTESALILDHIHEIIIQSPYQCATCKFYFTQKEQLLTHVREKHLQDQAKVLEQKHKWNCSACSRTKFAADGQKLLEHLKSSSHKIVESAIAKSIPIIIRQITPQTCPVTECGKMFILNRELVSHICSHHGPEFLPKDSSPSLSDNSELVISEGNERSNISYEVPDDSEVSPTDLILLAGTSPNTGNKLSRGRKIKQKTGKVLRPNNRTKRMKILASSELKGNGNSNSVLDHQYTSKGLHQDTNDILESTMSRNTRAYYSCQSCSYSTHKKSHFTRHLQTHEGESRRKDFHCLECSASFFEKGALTNHRKIHTGKTVKCPVPSCTFAGRNNSELKSHSVVHNSPGSYPCRLCEYSTKSKRHLIRHQRLVHSSSTAETTQTSFTCSKCKFNASSANGLKRHLLQHTEEAPYHCPFCDFRSKNIENLRTHVLKRQLHAGKHLYCCSICAEETGSTKVGRKSVYESNKFLDFRRHVEREHSNHPCAKSQKGIFMVAGIQKQDAPTANSSTAKIEVGSAYRSQGGCSRNMGKCGKAEKSRLDTTDAPVTLTTAELEQALGMPVQDVIQLDADFEMDETIFILDPYPSTNSSNKSYEICNYDVNNTHYVLLAPTELSAGS